MFNFLNLVLPAIGYGSQLFLLLIFDILPVIRILSRKYILYAGRNAGQSFTATILLSNVLYFVVPVHETV